MVPAHQRLQLGDEARVEVDDRLEVEPELLLAHGRAHLGLQPQALGGEGVHLRLEQPVLAFAALLGVVHGDVGAAQQVLGVAPPVVAGRDPDAGVDNHLVAVQQERRPAAHRAGQCGLQVLGEQPAVGQGGQRVVQRLVLKQGGRPGLGPLGPPHQQGHMTPARTTRMTAPTWAFRVPRRAEASSWTRAASSAWENRSKAGSTCRSSRPAATEAPSVVNWSNWARTAAW
jgi:hypothetical protein